MEDFLGMGQIIKEQRAEIERLQEENRLLFDNIKGNDADLERFNRALKKATTVSNGERRAD